MILLMYYVVLINGFMLLLCYSYNMNTNRRIQFNTINNNDRYSSNRYTRIYLRNANDDNNDDDFDDDFDGTFEERINKKYNNRYPSKSKKPVTVNRNSNIPFLFGLNRWEVII